LIADVLNLTFWQFVSG